MTNENSQNSIWQSAIGWLRDSWLMVGITIVLLVGVEVAFRIYDGIRPPSSTSMQRPQGPADPHWQVEWWPSFLNAREKTYRAKYTRFDPYRGWWTLPFQSPHLNIDNDGRRATVHKMTIEATGTILFVGGSTMWGYSAPDSHTIPTLVEVALAKRGLSIQGINLAQISFNSSQGVASIVKELRDGNRPLAVVSLDGVNDATVLYRGHQPGEIHYQNVMADRLARNSGTSALLSDIVSRLQIVKALRRKLGVPREIPPAQTESACKEVANQYGNLVEIVEALGLEFQFIPLMLWQPALATTQKPLTEWEMWAKGGYQKMSGFIKRCTLAVETRMVELEKPSFHSLTGLFDSQPQTTFLDEYGHVTLEGNQMIAQKIAELLEQKLLGFNAIEPK